jgi:hypothetical protein
MATKTIDTVGRQLLLNAGNSSQDELKAFQYLRGMGLNEKAVIIALRKVGVFTKIRINKKVGK